MFSRHRRVSRRFSEDSACTEQYSLSRLRRVSRRLSEDSACCEYSHTHKSRRLCVFSRHRRVSRRFSEDSACTEQYSLSRLRRVSRRLSEDSACSDLNTLIIARVMTLEILYKREPVRFPIYITKNIKLFFNQSPNEE